MSNTVIQIKRSNSTATPTNGTLSAGEQAYSYNSDKLFIGNTAGTGILEIGGKYWVDTTVAAFGTANAAFAAANAGSGAAFAQANTARDQANAAYTQANTATTNAGAAFGKANTAGTDATNAFGKANTAATDATNAYGQANTAFTNAGNAFGQANTALTTAQAAFGTANNALPKAGGTITGDLVVQGNATFSGLTTYANTQTLLIGDNLLTLNADLPPATAPSENAGMEVNRGSSATVALIWNEGTDVWTFTNDGSVYYVIPTNTAVETAQSTAVAAFGKANTAGTDATNAFGKANTAATDATNAYGQANTALTTAQAAFGKANTAGTDATNAYGQANTALTTGQAAFGKANSASTDAGAAFGQANTALTTAQAAFGKANTADQNAANGSYISTGVVKVPYGGTGMVSFTTNGILYGNTAGDLKVTAAGTEGQVLQASAAGVPGFGMLDGGTF